MTLFEEWDDLINNQTKDTVKAFWKEYSEGEMKIYSYLLSHKDENLEGTIKELSEKFGVREVIFEGFLDGVQSSLKDGESLGDIKSFDENTSVSVDVDVKKLYTNMLKANADHLYTLPEWKNVLSDEEREELTKEYKRSKIYHAPKKVGRNDPCPCGSGRKYKNCCGKNA
jgi:uncharacterized protein